MNIPYGRQDITQKDIDAVVQALKGDYLTQGPKVKEFEDKFAAYVGAKYAVAVSNGTGALHLSCLALGVNSESKVITTPITFAASSNSVLYCEGKVDFVDINPQTFLLDLDLLEKKLNANPGKYSGVIPVDFAGLPIDSERLRKIADKHGLWIIEDACHAPGGYFENSNGERIKCGSGVYADLTCFSFHPVKHLACGEGGMITTNDEKLYNHLLQLRTHGITKNPDLLEENHGGWYYEMQELGYNYRIPDINCALGVSQLEKASVRLEKRWEIAKYYDLAFKLVEGVTPQVVPSYMKNAYHLYVVLVENRKEVYDYLRENGIFAQIHYIPVHLLPYYKSLGWKKGDLVNAESYYEKCISLPMFPTLTKEEQDYVIQKVKEVVSSFA